VLYGSAAAGEHIPNRSDYNVLVVVDSLPLERLRAASAMTQAWIAAGNPAPLTMTAREWLGSSDIFPMEYADILERHRVLAGALPTDGVVVRADDLRLQVEHEAMAKLLKLRGGALAAGADGARQLELLERSLSTFMVVFRAVLRLHGEAPPTDNDSLSRAVAARAGFDAAPFVRVVQHVRGSQRLDKKDAGGVLASYLDAVERLVAYLDRFDGGSSTGSGGGAARG
jgi:hypothetical protein